MTGLVAQSAPNDDIFEPGSACGMPYAEEFGLSAVTRQPLSLDHSESRQPNWSAEKPNSASSARAMVRGSSSDEALGAGDGLAVGLGERLGLVGVDRVAAVGARDRHPGAGGEVVGAQSGVTDAASDGPVAAAASSPAASSTGVPADSMPPPTATAVATDASPLVTVAVRSTLRLVPCARRRVRAAVRATRRTA